MNLIVVFFMFFFMAFGQFPCNVVASDGSTYDLTRLASVGNISATDSNALWTYMISVCGNHVLCGTGSKTGYCQYGNIGGVDYHFNVGYLDQTIAHTDNGGVELLYYEPTEQRAGRVLISCNPLALIANITAITPENPLNYEFRFSSIAGCSTMPPCKVVSPNQQNSYDLTDFIGTSPITVTDGEYQYGVTVCQNGINNCNLCATAGYCQSAIRDLKFCIGKYQNISGNDDGSGVVLYYDEPVEGRKGKVFVTCDPQSSLVSDITAITPPVLTGYEFYFKSYAACPITPPCKAIAPDGTSYDLATLVLHPPLSGIDSINKWNYTLSICQDSLSCGNVNPAGYCQYLVDNPYVQYCIGKFDTIEGLNQGQGVKLTYKEPVEGRVGTVTVTCNPNGSLVSDITVVSPDLKTDYAFNFKSNAACGIN
jgi:hypothetical protein